MDKSILFPGVGVYANVDHVCLETTFLRFQTAILFLRKFGYELGTRTQEESCGLLSATMVKEGCVSIQLRESTKLLQVLSNENNIGVLVDDPEKVWRSIFRWTHENRLSMEMEKGSKGVIFVSIPEIVNLVIELVPTDVCPECGGLGKVILGCDGQSFETFCFKCDGTKYIKN